MNIMATTATLTHSAGSGEPIAGFHSIDEIFSSSSAELDRAAKNLVLPGPARRLLDRSSESLNIEAQQTHRDPSLSERGVLDDGHGDLFPRLGCAAAVYSWHRRRHWRNSDRGRRCSFRSRDDSRRRQGGGRRPPHNRRPHHRGGRCRGCWETSRWARTTVSEPRTVGLRDVRQASTVVGVPRRTVLQNARRVLADSERDDDPSFPSIPTLRRGNLRYTFRAVGQGVAAPGTPFAGNPETHHRSRAAELALCLGR